MTASHKILLAYLLLLPAAALADADCATGSRYPRGVVESFLKSCASKPEFKEFCECTIEKVQNNMSLYDYIDAQSTEGKSLQADPRFTEANQSCMGKIQLPPRQ